MECIKETKGREIFAKETNCRDEVSLIVECVNQILEESTREQALIELSKKRETFADLAIYIWYSPGVVSCLLQEITKTYQLLAPPVLNIQSSSKACNVLALFQCVAAHPDTRPAFLSAQIPIFFYPFLNTLNKNKPFEYLRLTALGVVGALVKVDNEDIISYLLSTEIIPLCLRVMERGSELSKTVATFIVQRILLDENGLNYVCNTAERFYAISSVLFNMSISNPSSRLVKHILRSYARLAENVRVKPILRDNLPQIFKDNNFYLSLDESSKRWLQNLFKSLSNISSSSIPLINEPINERNSTIQLIKGLNPGNGKFVSNQMEFCSHNAVFGDYSEVMDGSSNLNNHNSSYTNIKSASAYNNNFLNKSHTGKSFKSDLFIIIKANKI